jgi:hypothetical protein
MRQIARGPLGSELQKTESRAIMLQRQSPAPIEANGLLSREGEGPRKTLLSMVCERIARMIDYLFEMITRLFADHGCISAVESRASEPSELRVDPPIGKQPRRQIIVDLRGEPTIKSANVTYKPARPTWSALFPPQDAVGATRRTRERSSDRSVGTPSSSTTPSSSPRRSSQQISATSRHTPRTHDGPVVRASGDRRLTSSPNLNPKMLLTYKPTKEDT